MKREQLCHLFSEPWSSNLCFKTATYRHHFVFKHWITTKWLALAAGCMGPVQIEESQGNKMIFLRHPSACLPIPSLLPYEDCYDYIEIQRQNGQLLIFVLHFTWMKKIKSPQFLEICSIKHFPKTAHQLLSKCLGNHEKRRHFLKINRIKIHLSNSFMQPLQCHALRAPSWQTGCRLCHQSGHWWGKKQVRVLKLYKLRVG